ncbi:P450 monooxygenase [Apiospora phragmitis]|uniref:P450 monooxygenase n=1 Tax=Apiospora phragmitis TaxID=2905665 RepID=A0ABR1UVE0_9PEZI
MMTPEWAELRMPSTSQLAAGAILLIVIPSASLQASRAHRPQAYWVAAAIYNKFVSPLRKIPGPWLNAVSWLPWYKYWFSGYMHREVRRLHERYGPVVRIGPSEVSFIDKAAWKDIYSLKRCRQIERDPTSFPSLTPHGARFDLLTYSPADHAKYRKILNPCFAEKATKEYEGTVRANVDKLIAQLSAADGGQG